MSDWQSKWKSTNDKRYNRIYWWNVDTRYTSWFDPKDFTSEDEYLNKSEEVKQENKKKRKLENEELKSFREDFLIKVIDKLSDENKRLKEKVSELNDLLKKEKMINSSIKKSSLFDTLNIMIDENLRKDEKPSKNSIKI